MSKLININEKQEIAYEAPKIEDVYWFADLKAQCQCLCGVILGGGHGGGGDNS
jgi:hypothetical protein